MAFKFLVFASLCMQHWTATVAAGNVMLADFWAVQVERSPCCLLNGHSGSACQQLNGEAVDSVALVLLQTEVFIHTRQNLSFINQTQTMDARMEAMQKNWSLSAAKIQIPNAIGDGGQLVLPGLLPSELVAGPVFGQSFVEKAAICTVVFIVLALAHEMVFAVIGCQFENLLSIRGCQLVVLFGTGQRLGSWIFRHFCRHSSGGCHDQWHNCVRDDYASYLQPEARHIGVQHLLACGVLPCLGFCLGRQFPARPFIRLHLDSPPCRSEYHLWKLLVWLHSGRFSDAKPRNDSFFQWFVPFVLTWACSWVHF